MSWPDEMLLLEASDMCKGSYSRGKRHCLEGHALRALGSTYTIWAWSKLRDAIAIAARSSYIAEFNDSHTLATNARVWNRALYLLGYTEGNPESEPLPNGLK